MFTRVDTHVDRLAPVPGIEDGRVHAEEGGEEEGASSLHAA
jgi:hypothetical protein